MPLYPRELSYPGEPLCSRELLLNRIEFDEHMLPLYVNKDSTTEQLCDYFKIMEEYKEMNTIEKRREEYKRNSANTLSIFVLIQVFLIICFCLVVVNFVMGSTTLEKLACFIYSPILSFFITLFLSNWILP